MSLLDKAKEFYRSVRAERKATDPLTIKTRELLIGQFPQGGYQAATAVDAEVAGERRAATPVNAGQRSVKSWAPGQGVDLNPPVRKPSVALPAQGNKIRGRMGATSEPEKTATDTDELGLNTSGTFNQSQLETLEQESQSGPAVEVNHLSEQDLERIKDSTPKQVATDYGVEDLKAYLNQHDIPYNKTGSERQIAATLIKHLKGE